MLCLIVSATTILPTAGRPVAGFAVVLFTLSAEHFSFKPKVHWMIEMLVAMASD